MELPEEEKVNKRERVELVTESQVKQFMNKVYCSSQPKNDEIYSKGIVTTKEIYGLVKTYTTIFREKTTRSFATWCRKKSQRVIYFGRHYYGKPRYDRIKMISIVFNYRRSCQFALIYQSTKKP